MISNTKDSRKRSEKSLKNIQRRRRYQEKGKEVRDAESGDIKGYITVIVVVAASVRNQRYREKNEKWGVLAK